MQQFYIFSLSFQSGDQVLQLTCYCENNHNYYVVKYIHVGSKMQFLCIFNEVPKT